MQEFRHRLVHQPGVLERALAAMRQVLLYPVEVLSSARAVSCHRRMLAGITGIDYSPWLDIGVGYCPEEGRVVAEAC